MQKRIVLFVLLVCLTSGQVRAKVSMDVPRHYVEDQANVIDGTTERSLNGLLQELEQKTGAQYIVLTVKSMQGLPIEQFSIELAEQWQLGQKGKDNGMLFVLAVKERMGLRDSLRTRTVAVSAGTCSFRSSNRTTTAVAFCRRI
jgi:uncharacterized membrane protein YgcG